LETDGKDSNKKGIRVLKLTQEQKAEHEAKKTQLIEVFFIYYLLSQLPIYLISISTSIRKI